MMYYIARFLINVFLAAIAIFLFVGGISFAFIHPFVFIIILGLVFIALGTFYQIQDENKNKY